MNPIRILSQPTEKYESMKFGKGKKGEIGKLDSIKQIEEKGREERRCGGKNGRSCGGEVAIPGKQKQKQDDHLIGIGVGRRALHRRRPPSH